MESRSFLVRYSIALFGALTGVVCGGFQANAGVQTLHIFASRPLYPNAPLVQDQNGDSYGTTQGGGQDDQGTVYKITAAGEMVVLHSFSRSNNGGVEGGTPQTGLTLASDGNFYGTTGVGGAHGNGTIFRITPEGAFTSIYHFGSTGMNWNKTALIEGDDGYLYGTTEGSYPEFGGTIFRITLEGAYTELHHFESYGHGLDGAYPGPLTKARDGKIYGASWGGGEHGYGTFYWLYLGPGFGLGVVHHFEGWSHGTKTRHVELETNEFYGVSGGDGAPGLIYRISSSGAYTELHTLPGALYDYAESEELVVGDDGNLYGTYPYGGTGQPPNDAPIVFRFNPSGAFDTIHGFVADTDGTRPRTALARTGQQTFQGVTLDGGLYGEGTVFRVTEQGAFTTFHNFSMTNDGVAATRMVLLEDGNVYGTTWGGGLHALGTIFRITPTGEFVTVYDFQGNEDGGGPSALVAGADGFLYGISYHASNQDAATLFKFSPTGAFSAVHGYDAGSEIMSIKGLMLGADGNFYATSGEGGTDHAGAIIKITVTGELTVTHSFVRATDGAGPYSTLVQDADGFLYGIANRGGANDEGTVFKCSPAGDLTVLHDSTVMEGSPFGDVALGLDGSVYGTTPARGQNGSGTIFRVTQGGEYQVLYNFESESSYYGETSLVTAPDGTLYGSRVSDGAFNRGFLFKLDPKGVFTTVYSFNGGPGGEQPGALSVAPNGLIYGSTAGGGGADGLGTVFALTTDAPATLLNISTRMRVETGSNVLIGGFIITGNRPKELALRGIGPSLAAFGISDVLADPILELHAANGALMIQNDEWESIPGESPRLIELGLGLKDSKESGIVAPLQPNAYTVILAGKNQTAGVGLVELYDADQAAPSQLGNISTRGLVEDGSNVMIGGFILGGDQGVNVAIRGIGPSLSQFGINPALMDPVVELHDANGDLIVANDNWEDDPDSAAQLVAYGIAPQDSHESAIFTSLPPGSFTGILTGQAGGTGIGLIEIYNLH